MVIQLTLAAAHLELEIIKSTWEPYMPRVLRHDLVSRTQNDWMVAIPAGLVIAALLGFVAFYPTRAPHVASAGERGTVGMAGIKAEPAAKKPVRYEATIENWKRYRAANQPAE